ncbi:hypothetical protein [Catellatospora sp. TT07R-123]|uniref:hypothetical protein n=1 Tax=Catellatospora sp. TT07R-123 TaxID=2733863 RepID=UPI001FD3D1A9|nr:hypothetical protein [Catellatospora sp. TT07R-123]
MITLQAVVEVPNVQGTPVPWPVAPLAPLSWLVLNGECVSDQVGLFVAALVVHVERPAGAGPAETVDALLAEESLIVSGGLRVMDTDTGMAVTPGCCSGLEDWRHWSELLSGESPWMGHDPAPRVEFLDDRLRVWQDDHLTAVRQQAEAHVDLPQSIVPTLLDEVQRDLVDFLGALDAWSRRIVPDSRAQALARAVDRSLAVSGPLALPGGRG